MTLRSDGVAGGGRLLCAFVGFIVFAVLGSGLLPTLGMSMGIVSGAGGGMPSMTALMMPGAGGGYAVAGAIGGGLLWALALTVLAQVYLLGLNLVYLRVTEGLDASAAEAAMRSRPDDAKRLTNEIADRAKPSASPASRSAQAYAADDATPRIAAASTATSPGSAAASSAAEPAAPRGASARPGPATIACPQCRATCSSDDLFCGGCGQRVTA